MKYHILLVEDEVQICEVIMDYLSSREEDQITVDCVHTGDEGIEKVLQTRYDLLLLDIMLPGMDGFTLCRELRRYSDVPVIFVTARGREEDRLLGYRTGCDDYIVKPFSLPVLYAKISALIKRSKGMVQTQEMMAGTICLNPSSCIITENGREIDATFREYELLKYLLEHKGRTCTREELLNNVWGYDFDGNDRVVDNHIKKLRKKLGPEGRRIKTIVKRGYQMADE